MTFNIGPFTIDLGLIITFFTGAIFGFVLMALWYMVAVLSSLNKGIRRRNVDVEDIDEKEIKWLIDDAHKLFKDKEKRDAVGYGQHLLNISLDLSNDIATKFYPKSKYPYLELTLDESLILLKYVSTRFESLLNKGILKMFKGITLRRLITLNDAKVKFDNNLLVKQANKFKIGEWLKKVGVALNPINPIYWMRVLVLDKITNAIMIKLGLVIISLTGEETYRIYSKKVFNEDKEIDSGIDSIYEEIVKMAKGDTKLEEVEK